MISAMTNMRMSAPAVDGMELWCVCHLSVKNRLLLFSSFLPVDLSSMSSVCLDRRQESVVLNSSGGSPRGIRQNSDGFHCSCGCELQVHQI
jgi:hypothetical protein